MTPKPRQLTVPIDDIHLSGENMRDDVGDLVELSKSISEHGILQPLLVSDTTGSLLLVCGHRRLAAARRANLKEVPVIVRTLEDHERLSLMVAENVHRRHLSPIEEGKAFQRLTDEGYTQYEVADLICKSQTYVSNRLKLLTLPKRVQNRVHDGKLAILKALDAERERYVPREGRHDGRDVETKWQAFYVDKLLKWLEGGSLNLNDDDLIRRLGLLHRALAALTKRLEKKQRKLPVGVHMCELCGTVVGVKRCCKEHGELCDDCKQGAHRGAA